MFSESERRRSLAPKERAKKRAGDFFFKKTEKTANGGDLAAEGHAPDPVDLFKVSRARNSSLPVGQASISKLT